MKKIIYLLAWIGVALASCSDESSLPIQPEISAEPRVDGLEAGGQRLVDRVAVQHVGGLGFEDTTTLNALDLAEAVERLDRKSVV